MSISTYRTSIWSTLLRPTAFLRSDAASIPQWYPSITSQTSSLSSRLSMNTQAVKLHRSEIFEELSPEYLPPQPSIPQAGYKLSEVTEAENNQFHQYHASDVLIGMLSKGDFSGADTTRKDLLSMGTPILPNVIYVDAAKFALEKFKGQERRESFMSWWALVPRQDWGSNYAFLEETIRETQDWKLMQVFSIECIGEGFVNEIANSLLPYVIRYANVTVSISFVRSFVNAVKARGSTTPLGNIRSGPKYTSGLLWMRWYNLAIRQYYLGGNQAFAAELLLQAHKDGVKIEKKTYDILQHRMEQIPAEVFHQIKKLMQMDFPFSQVIAHSRQDGKEAEEALGYSHFDKATDTAHMAQHLRYIRKTVLQRPNFDFGIFVTTFLRRYTNSRGQVPERIILNLRKRVLERGDRPTQAIWICAEQSFYDAIHRPLANLRIFMRCCDNQDFAAKDEALRILDPSWQKRMQFYNKDLQVTEEKLPMKMRMWPYHRNLTLAWKALLQLAKNPRDMEIIYAKLLNQAKLAFEMEVDADKISAKVISDSDDIGMHELDELESAEGKAMRLKPIAAYFSPFIIGFGQRVSPTRAAEIIKDMRRLGYEPTLENWFSLSASYSRSGLVEETYKILDHTEKMALQHHKINAEDQLKSYQEGGSVHPHEVLTGSAYRTIVKMYNCVIRGFLECGLWAEADKVRDRAFERRYFYAGRQSTYRERDIMKRLKKWKQKGDEDYNVKQTVKRGFKLVNGVKIYANRDGI